MDFLAGEEEAAWGEVVKMPERRLSFLWSLIYSPFVVYPIPHLYIYVEVWWAKIASTHLMAIY